MNPDDKYLNPRPAPAPKPRTSENASAAEVDRSSSPKIGRSAFSSKQRNASFNSRRSGNLNRLLSYARKASVSRVSRSLSPKRISGPRAALRRSTAPRSAGTGPECDRGRRGGTGLSVELRISAPTLISRTDNTRHCIPLRDAQSDFLRTESPLPVFSPEEQGPIRSSAVAMPPAVTPQVHPSQYNSRPRSESKGASPFENAMAGDDLGCASYSSSWKAVSDSEAEENAYLSFAKEGSEGGSSSPRIANFAPSVRLTEWEAGEDARPEVLDAILDTFQPPGAANNELNERSGLKPDALRIDAGRPQLLRSYFSAYSTTTVAPSPPLTATIDDHTSPSLSYATDTSNDPLSPYHLSFQFDQSPNIELDDEYTNFEHSIPHSTYDPMGETDSLDSHRRPTSLHSSTFQGYSLPREDHESELTLRKIPTPRFPTPRREPTIESQDSAGFVQSWNDGSAHRLTATEELLSELGYLSGMIVSN